MNRGVQVAPYARLSLDGGDLLLDSSYDPGIVASLKMTIPASDRAWDKGRRVWRIAPRHGQAVADLFKRAWGLDVAVPAARPVDQARPEMRVIKLEYLGQCKAREDGSTSAMGYADGAWSVIAPESVLRAWFEGGEADQPRAGVGRETLYGLLGVAQTASPDEVKKGYRRMARQWHPDLNKEEGAADRFRAIKAAHDVLADPQARKKYDAGLFFEAHAKQPQAIRSYGAVTSGLYRSPLCCGMVVAEATPALGRWTLHKIIGWQDIVDSQGRVMISYWPKDGQQFEVRWVAP